MDNYCNSIFPSNITEDEAFLLKAYSRLVSAQKTLRQIKEYKKIQLNEQKTTKAKALTPNVFNATKNTAKTNTDAIKKLVAAGKINLGASASSKPTGFRRRTQTTKVLKKSDVLAGDVEPKPLLNKRAPNPEHEKIKAYTGPGVTEDQIADVFGRFGNIRDIRLVGRGPTPDTALIHYEDMRSAIQAVKEMNDSTHDQFVAKLQVGYTRRQSETMKRAFERKKEEDDPAAFGRKMVVYEDETDLFD